MMIEPPIDELVKKVGNPYALAVMAGKRARHLQTILSEEELIEILIIEDTSPNF